MLRLIRRIRRGPISPAGIECGSQSSLPRWLLTSPDTIARHPTTPLFPPPTRPQSRSLESGGLVFNADLAELADGTVAAVWEDWTDAPRLGYAESTGGLYRLSVLGEGASSGDDTIRYRRFLRLQRLHAGLAGDLDGDGIVGSADLDLLRENWGQNTVGLENGDANGDGAVDGGDLDIVRANWGRHAPAAAPEPSILLSGLVVDAFLACRRRRKDINGLPARSG